MSTPPQDRRTVLLVIAGEGLGKAEAARIQAAVQQVDLPGSPRIYAVTIDAPALNSANYADRDLAFATVLRVTADSIRDQLPLSERS
jgi:hypothetical protein